MATNDKDIDQLVAVTDSYLSLEGSSKRNRRLRKESVLSKEKRSCILQNDEHLDRKIEILINNSIDSIEVSKFLYDHIFKPASDDDDDDPENHISAEEKNCINMLLKRREDITERVSIISKENEECEEILFRKKLQLEDITKERRETWNKAVKVLNSLSPKLKNSPKDIFPSSYSSDDVDCNSYDLENSARNIYKIEMISKMDEKYRRIQEIAGVLHKLISFSGLPWAKEKKLLDIVLFTGKILNTPYTENNPRVLEKFVMDCVLKLNEMKWELLL